MEGRIKETRNSSEPNSYNPRPLALLAAILAIIALLLFASHRYFSLAKAIDGSLWGEYGDFIGGVVGTIIAYISIRLLVETLRAQNKANQIASITAKDNDYTYRLQQLNDHFQMLIRLYRETLSEFKDNENANSRIGKAYLQGCIDAMRTGMGECQSDYASRNKKAIEQYSLFYTNHRDVASVYFRIVYRLWELIFDTPLVLQDKLRYVKILRCQFSEAELFLIRYNAMTSNGTKMQYYANQFNITKHLPELSLLEFTFWRNQKFDNAEASRNLLVTYFIALRKSIILRIKEDVDDELKQIGGRYKVSDEYSGNQFTLTVKRDKRDSSASGSLSAVFDTLTLLELRDLMVDFLVELFVYRSFCNYQKPEDISIEKPHDNSGDFEIIKIQVNATRELVLYKNNDPNIIGNKDASEIESTDTDYPFEEGL